MASPHQYIGFPQGLFALAIFTSAAEVLAAGLSDGDIWVIVNPDGTLEAGAWPQTPGPGPTPGGCSGGPHYWIMGSPPFIYYQHLGSQAGATTLLPYEPNPDQIFLIANPT